MRDPAGGAYSAAPDHLAGGEGARYPLLPPKAHLALALGASQAHPLFAFLPPPMIFGYVGYRSFRPDKR